MSEQIHTAVNGFGRIGVVFARLAIGDRSLEFDAIGGRDISAEDISERLMFDTVHREFVGHDVRVANQSLYVDGEQVALVDTSSLHPETWSAVREGLIIADATGAYRTYEKSMEHVAAGAAGVVVTSPVNDEAIPTIVRGVNDTDSMLELAAQRKVVAVSSCSTNCIAPILKLFGDAMPIESAHAQVVHARTNSQPHLDGRGNATSDRRSADNIVASSTGSATEVQRLLPRIPFYSNSIRVPVPDGSLAIIQMEISKAIVAADVIELLKEAGRHDGVIGTSEHDLFSAAVIGKPYSSLVDLNEVRITPHRDRTSVELQAWFDNEWGYGTRVAEIAAKLGRRILS